MSRAGLVVCIALLLQVGAQAGSGDRIPQGGGASADSPTAGAHATSAPSTPSLTVDNRGSRTTGVAHGSSSASSGGSGGQRYAWVLPDVTSHKPPKPPDQGAQSGNAWPGTPASNPPPPPAPTSATGQDTRDVPLPPKQAREGRTKGGAAPPLTPPSSPSSPTPNTSKPDGSKPAGPSTPLTGDVSKTPAAQPVDAGSWTSYNQCLQANYKALEDGYRHTTDVLRWQLVESNIVFFLVIALVLTGVVFSWLQFRESMVQAAFRRSVVASAAATAATPPGAGAAAVSSGATALPAASSEPSGNPSGVTDAATGSAAVPNAPPASTAETPPTATPGQPVAGVPPAGSAAGDAQASATAQDTCAVDMKLSPEGVEVHTSVLGVVILLISLAFFFLYLKYVYPVVVLPQ